MTADTLPARLRRRYISDIQTVADAESDAYRARVAPPAANRRVAIILVTAAVALTALNFGATSRPHWFLTLLELVGLDALAAAGRDAFFVSPQRELNGLMFWGTIQVLSYVAIPVLVIRFVLREKISDFGTRVGGILSHGRTYLALFAVAVPFIVLASTTASFQARYPFYDLAAGESLWPNMWLWWLFYAAQFAALEFFFRGFLVHGLKGRLGYIAIFVMLVPYNMLHFTKPVLEALAAIPGGYVLGSLSLRTRSIWWGAALHCAVAGTMDVLALIQKGLL